MTASRREFIKTALVVPLFPAGVFFDEQRKRISFQLTRQAVENTPHWGASLSVIQGPLDYVGYNYFNEDRLAFRERLFDWFKHPFIEDVQWDVERDLGTVTYADALCGACNESLTGQCAEAHGLSWRKRNA